MRIDVNLVVIIGRINSNNTVNMLGTGFIINNDGVIVTSRHVVSDDDKNLCVIISNIKNINEYQDISDNKCNMSKAKIIKSDPFRDIRILKADIKYQGNIFDLGTTDEVDVGEDVLIVGYPHCVSGRRALTFQKAMVGSKVLLECQEIKSKHIVVNTQTRPGQSGSLIYSVRHNKLIGMLVGTFAFDCGVQIAGINPNELNQTTHCISSEYIKNML